MKCRPACMVQRLPRRLQHGPGEIASVCSCLHAWTRIHAPGVVAAAKPLSEDHKPNRQDERARIEDAGGVVVWAGTWRVGGVLAVSRAFGDRLLKK